MWTLAEAENDYNISFREITNYKNVFTIHILTHMHAIDDD